MKAFRKYFIVFLITAALFALAWFASKYFNNQKLAAIQQAQEQATVDVMSSETQFDLLESQSCQDIGNTALAQEISDLADKLTYAQENIDDQNQVALLKQQYSVLEVKDYLLTKEISERCKSNIATVLYFYKTDGSCADCTKQGYVLDALRQAYPQVRVYSFDAGLDSSTIRALLSVYKIPATLPTLVINGKTITGYQDLPAIEKILPSSTLTSKKSANPTAQ